MNDEDINMHSKTTKTTQTESPHDSKKRKICGLTIKEVIDCCSVFLLPCMLGIFTVVITLYQANLSNQQRLEDQKGARELREQDLNNSQAQREQDLAIAKSQREEDVLRRLQDFNATQMQRDNDLHTAELRRELDKELAELQRNLSDKQRSHELMIEANRYEQEFGKYRHGLLTVYMNEIEALVVKYNGTITSDHRMATIIRGKTLALIRQLDVTLKAHLIRFLYEAGQLTNGQQPLDMTDAELDGINMSSTTSDIQPMHGLMLSNAYLTNASFVRRDLTGGNFSGARLANTHFLDSIASNVDFSGATLTNASFSNTILVNASFVGSIGHGTKLDRVDAADANFSQAVLPASSFVQSSLHRTNFIQSNLSAANFSLANLNETLFINAWLGRSNFDMVDGRHIRFSYANLQKASLQRSHLILSYFDYIHALDANFAFSDMHAGNFTKAYAHRCNFSNAILTQASFINAWMNRSSFVNATLTLARLSFFDADFSNFSYISASSSNFSDCRLVSTDFSNSVLMRAEFRRTQAGGINLSLTKARQAIFTESYMEMASFVYADVEEANFINANLRKTKLMHSNFNTTQLRQAMAIFGAILPSANSTVTREYNLITNGGANCNISVSKYWQVQNGVVGLGYHNSTDCYFTPVSANGTVTMSQEIDVKRYINKVLGDSISENRPDTIMLSYQVGGGTVVRLVGKPTNVQFNPLGVHQQNGFLKYPYYPKKTTELHVVVEFGSMNQSAWCDQIDLWIQVAQFAPEYDD